MTFRFSILAGLCLTLGVLGTSANAAAQTFIVSQLSQKCLDAQGGSNASGTPIITWACHGGSNQSVTYTNGTLRVMGKCLDAAGGAGRNGDAVVLWDCHGGANQKWQLRSDGLIQGINGRCLDIANGSKNNGAKLVLWDCHGGTNQKWQKGRLKSASSAGLDRGQVENLYNRAQSVGGVGIIAPGGGNIIAPGGGNIIAAGGGNIIATGGGNIIATGGLN